MMSDHSETLGLLLHDSARLMRRYFDMRASAHGLSSAQWRLLVRVAKEPGIAQARLAELLEIEPISVSRLVDRMTDGGWIERRLDPADRRVRQIFPTDLAMATFGEAKAVAAEVFEMAMTGLDRSERAALMHGLKTVIKNLSDGDAVGSKPKVEAA
ncbi:MAG: MarR family transcriptional regulator [Mesorhizobium sp.]